MEQEKYTYNSSGLDNVNSEVKTTDGDRVSSARTSSWQPWQQADARQWVERADSSNGRISGAPAGAAMGIAATESKATRAIMARVFAQLFTGLLLTSFAALFFFFSGVTLAIAMTTPAILMVASIVQLGVVIAFSFTLKKASPTLSTILFYVYSLLTGFTLSVIFLYYTAASILYSFGVTALVFGAMAIWGHNTKKDLSTIGTVGRMLLFGAIIVSFVNIILYFFAPGFATALDMILNYVILAIFVGLTAYDMQKIREHALMMGAFEQNEQAVAARKVVATQGALTLYLDFINIFIRILSIFGRRD
ncbi:MAG: Bax inhibitor-1 family protein [Fastidiosipilaceae bacterium]